VRQRHERGPQDSSNRVLGVLSFPYPYHTVSQGEEKRYHDEDTVTCANVGVWLPRNLWRQAWRSRLSKLDPRLLLDRGPASGFFSART
jgi:hypothetical protein